MAAINAHIYKLLTWLSPSYPIGSYAYSHGIESAIEHKLIVTGNDLYQWIKFILYYGSARVDAWLLKVAYQAISPSQPNSLRIEDVIEYANTIKSTPELWLESSQQGAAFMRILLQTNYSEQLIVIEKYLKENGLKPTFSLIFGIICAEHQIEVDLALTAFLYAFAANLVSVGLRLLPLGQTAGQRIIKDLDVHIQKCVNMTNQTSLETLGSVTAMVDWTSSQHVTQYSRLFLS